MLVKRGNAEIVNVISDDEHKLDDEGTRKAMGRAAKEPTWAEGLTNGNTGETTVITLPKDTEIN